jgi:hypothetical protein
MTSRTIVSILVAILVTVAAHLPATPVSFWMRGEVTSINNPSNALPFAVNVGDPFSARFTYDSNYVESSYSYTNQPAGRVSGYYITNTLGISLLFQFNGHTITNRALPFVQTGQIAIEDDNSNRDVFYAESGKGIMLDGSDITTNPFFSGFNFTLRDNSKTAYTNTTIPATPPVTTNFTQNTLTWGLYHDNGIPSTLFSINFAITSLSTNELVTLNHRMVSPGTVQFGWPVIIPGYTLQSSTNLALNIWQNVGPIVDINVEHTVNVPLPGHSIFFRLMK